MQIKKLDTSIDHSVALREALVLRNAGIASPAVEDTVGLILYNIARWALSERDALWREHEDAVSDINYKLLTVLPKVDLTLHPRKILIYLKNTATNYIKDQEKASRRQKRSADLVDIEDLPIATDYRGQRIY